MQEDKIKTVNIYVEEHQGSLYAWRKRDHKFMGQGVDLEALFQRLYDEVPENEAVMFKISVEEGGEILAEKLKSMLAERNASDDGAKTG